MGSVIFSEALLPDGWARNVRVTMADGLITSVEADAEGKGYGIGLPGLANLHSHAFQRGMAGLSETRGPGEDSFWTWREVMYRFLAAMTPDDVEAISAFAFMEMLEGGFTRVGEFHYLHHDATGAPYGDVAELSARIIAASASTGISLSLLPVFYAHGNFGGVAPDPGQRRFINDLDRFARLLDTTRGLLRGVDGATLGIAPHSLRAVTGDELAVLQAMMPDAPVHIHAAEQTREVDDCLAWSGARPVEWLLDHADLGPRWCLVHATHMTEAETTRLARSGAAVGLCPLTEASLGDGIFPGRIFMEAGGRYGIGTDSNIQIGAAAELRQLEYGQRLGVRRRNVMAAGAGQSTGGSLFRAAAEGGHQALGCDASGLRAGAPADVIALDAEDASLIGRHGDALLDSWIFAGTRPVSAAWVRGRQIVADGQHIDRPAIAARYRRCLDRLLGG